MKKLFIFISAFVLVLLLASLNTFAQSTSYYYECDGVANSYEIDLSEDKLSKCRNHITNPVDVGNLVSYNATINQQYKVQTYHFYVPRDGYYAVYTTGSSDTIIRIYREKQVLWWFAGFIGDKPTVDDGSICDSNYANACSIEYLAKGYYYAAVRMYGAKTGSYKMNIGPNEDLLYRSKYRNYNRWICENNDPYYSGLNIYTNYIQYFTYEQTVLFYKLLVGELTLDNEYCVKYGMSKVTPEGILDLKENNYSTYIDFVGFIAGVICSVAQASPAVSITVASVAYIASLLCNMPALTKNVLITKIKDTCGYYTIPVSFDTTRTCFEKCLALQEWYTTDVPVGITGYNYDVIGYNDNDTYLRGLKNAKGHWESM